MNISSSTREAKYLLLALLDNNVVLKALIKTFLVYCKIPLHFIGGFFGIQGVLKENLKILEMPGNVFQGYYGKKVTSEHKYLVHRLENDSVALVLFDEEYFTEIEIIRSRYWNYQQGCMVEFFGLNGLVYNGEVNEKPCVCLIRNIGDNDPVPVASGILQEVSMLGVVATVALGPINKLRPEYGFKFRRDECLDLDSQIVEFSSIGNLYNWQITADDLVGIVRPRFTSGGIKANHVQFSPAGVYAVGMLRYFDARKRKLSALIRFEIDTKKIICLLKDEVISHYCWMNEHQLVYWGTHNGKARGYWKMSIFSSRDAEITAINNLKDGHPIALNETTFVTDTYPDAFGRITLYACSLDGSIKNLLTFPGHWTTSLEKRVDAHPKYCKSEDLVTIDLYLNGRRRIGSICKFSESLE